MGIHPRIASRVPNYSGAPDKMRKKRGCKPDPHKATVGRLLKEGGWNVVVILCEIRAGFTACWGGRRLRLRHAPIMPGRRPGWVCWACQQHLGVLTDQRYWDIDL